MRRYLSFLTALFLFLGIVPFQVLADSQDTMTGSGTEADPYIIMTLDHLDAVRNNLSAHYKLGADIDASETANWNNGDGFIPISGDGSASSPFTGVFDGQRHVIIDLTINQLSTDFVGLFGIIGSGGVVRNVGLAGGSITGNATTGGLAGRNFGTVDQSYVTGIVSSIRGIVGGLVGYNGNGSIVTNSYVSGAVSGTTYVGGLVGRNDQTVNASYATGTVSGTSIVGGLIGDNEAGTVTHSYATGAVSGSGDHVGGLVGYNISANISQSYATGAVSGRNAVGGLVGSTDFGMISQSFATGTVSGNYTGGLVGSNSGIMSSSFWDTDTTGMNSGCGSDTGICTANGLTTAQALTQTSYSGWDFTNDWFMIDGSTRPFLRSEYSTAITNTHQLQLMEMNLATNYMLANTIDFGTIFTDSSRSDMWATSTSGGGIAGAGFAPIGGNGHSFSGTFDGLGRIIRNLTIHRPQSSDIGLFSIVSPNGVVKSIGLEEGSVAGNIAVGGLVGLKFGTVSNAYNTGSVSGVDSVGGLVGRNSEGTISEAYAAGSVNGNTFVGGLVGENYAEVSDAYGAGAVSGSLHVGGLVGLNRIGGTVSVSFYDSQTTGQSDDGKGTPETTSQMKRQSTFETEWDFTDTWMIEEGKTYPLLQAIADNKGFDVAPPTIVSAKVEDDHPDRVVVTFDEDVSSTDISGITIKVNGSDATITNLSVTTQKVLTFTIEKSVGYGQEVTISYEGQLGNIVDAAHNPLYSVVNLTVENNIVTLEAPTSLTAAAGDSQITLNWNRVTNAESYKIYVSTASGAYTETPTATTTEATYSLTGLTYGTTYYFTVKSSNAKGDSVYSNEVSAVLLDHTPPTISITMKTADGTDYEDNTWTNQNVTVTANASDAKSGLASFMFSADGGATWRSYTSDLILQGDNVYMFSFKAVDTAGNETVEQRTVKISTSGLMLTPALMKSDGSAYTSGTWTNDSVTVSVYAEAGAIGINDFTYTLDGGTMQPYVNDTAIVFAQEGMHTIIFQLTDEAGNTLSSKLAVNIDKAAPSVNFGMNGSESWVRSAQTTVMVTDTLSGADSSIGVNDSTLQYAWTADTATPASGWTSFTSGDALTKSGVDGDWYLHIQALDKAGNLANAVSNRFRMDASVAALSSLTASEGTLSPAFATGTTSYTVSVGNSVSSMTITPVTIDTTDTMTVNVNGGTAQHVVSGERSEPLALNVGDNTIKLHVTALNGLQQTYTVTATRAERGTSSSSGGGDKLPTNRYFVGMEGGTITFDGGQIFIPAGALTRSIYLTINEVLNTNALSLSNRELLISKVIGLTKDQPGKLNKDAIITLQFNANTIQKQDVKVSLYWLNEETHEWLELDNTAVDWEKGTVSGATDHFAKFAVIATPLNAAAQQPQEKEESAVHFTDIQGHWAEKDIQQLAGKGAVNGYADGTFKPDNPITRAEFAAILVRALGIPQKEGMGFADTADHWASQAISSAYAYGIIHGYDQHIFAPDKPITREQMVIMIVNALQLENVQASQTFADQGTISVWAQKAVAAAVEHGMIAGYPDNTMKPKARATRAEAVTVILHAIEKK